MSRQFGSLWRFGRGRMPTGPSSGGTEPPHSTAPLPRVPRHSLRRVLYPAAWAAAGLIVIAGSGAFFVSHRPGARPPGRTPFCGLVACAVLRSDAATSSLPTVSPGPAPPPSPSLAASPRAPAPAPRPAPGPSSAPPATVPDPAPPSPAPPRSPPPHRRLDDHQWWGGAGGGRERFV